MVSTERKVFFTVRHHFVPPVTEDNKEAEVEAVETFSGSNLLDEQEE
jgi:hypothetical protein